MACTVWKLIFPGFHLQSDQAGWDNSAQKLKNTNNLAVFDHFGVVKYKILELLGALPPGPPPETSPVFAGGLTVPPEPSWIRE